MLAEGIGGVSFSTFHFTRRRRRAQGVEAGLEGGAGLPAAEWVQLVGSRPGCCMQTCCMLYGFEAWTDVEPTRPGTHQGCCMQTCCMLYGFEAWNL
jgi:hypothetical protein